VPRDSRPARRGMSGSGHRFFAGSEELGRPTRVFVGYGTPAKARALVTILGQRTAGDRTWITRRGSGGDPCGETWPSGS
jgi:hypothetical protein